MRSRFLVPTLFLAAAGLLAAEARAGSLAGVTLPDRATVGEQSLALNGLGLRSRYGIKVYVAGLYLAAKQSDPAAILAADAPRRMVMHFLREVDRTRICEGWSEGLAANTANPSAALRQQFGELCTQMADAAEGTEVVLTYLPGEGTSVQVGGAVRARIPGKDFADALLACWIGPRPGPGESFKRSLLGG
ncbi:MAG: chalcone isomerase family protein [Thermoanaerobaculia bacterium]|nr:chalcone isomerase family protein [Thermoanaerobaculia bacterium]